MHILTIVGARPQFVKAAAVSRAFRDFPKLHETILHTGQHFDHDMSNVFFDELEIPAPKYNLNIHGGGHGDMTGRMLQAIEPIVANERPEVILVYGDTNSTLAGALTAAKLLIRLAHVEAGLRTGERRMPEEVNRIVTDHLSDWLFCPTQLSVDFLRREGIEKGVHFVGDVMFDATLFALKRTRERSRILERHCLEYGRFAVATIHRQENTDDADQLRKVIDWLKQRAKEMTVVFSIHPRTRKAAAAANIDLNGLLAIEPVTYFDMALLLDSAAAVYTDSGGLQKEAYFHRKPCVTVFPVTAWPETIEAGWNRLWQGDDYRTPRRDIPDYGTGAAAHKTAAILNAG
jgi:UDP-GlcNAc3NAcA epimerase